MSIFTIILLAMLAFVLVTGITMTLSLRKNRGVLPDPPKTPLDLDAKK